MLVWIFNFWILRTVKTGQNAQKQIWMYNLEVPERLKTFRRVQVKETSTSKKEKSLCVLYFWPKLFHFIKAHDLNHFLLDFSLIPFFLAGLLSFSWPSSIKVIVIIVFILGACAKPEKNKLKTPFKTTLRTGSKRRNYCSRSES